MSASFNRDTLIPPEALQELLREINREGITHVIDICSPQDKHAKSLSVWLNLRQTYPMAADIHSGTIDESTFLADNEPNSNGSLIITIPSPELKYNVIERIMRLGDPAFLLVQTTVLHSHRLNDLKRAYKRDITVLIPYRRIHFGGGRCPFDTLWLGINCKKYLDNGVHFSSPFPTIRQSILQERKRLRQVEDEILNSKEVDLSIPPPWPKINQEEEGELEDGEITGQV